MSDRLQDCRTALETALNALPALHPTDPNRSTAWDNVAFEADPQYPYQRAYFMPAEPDNPVYGSGWVEQGLFQVSLFYPRGTGTGDITARAKVIRDTFFRGATFTSGSVQVVIEKTPEIGVGSVDGDRWMVPVKIRWFANNFN